MQSYTEAEIQLLIAMREAHMAQRAATFTALGDYGAYFHRGRVDWTGAPAQLAARAGDRNRRCLHVHAQRRADGRTVCPTPALHVVLV